MNLIYAGIGSSETPDTVQPELRRIAGLLAKQGFVLRSGAGGKADVAFEEGCDAAGGAKEIWLPWRGFNQHADTGFYPTSRHFEIALSTHKLGDRLKENEWHWKMHARNVGQALGADCATPVAFVVCWTKDGSESAQENSKVTGGSATAIALASGRGIPVFNLAREDAYARMLRWVRRIKRRFHQDGTLPQHGEHWVFGSNLAGRHGAGAAKVAKLHFGAVKGRGEGPMGHCYGIPTKDGRNNQDLKLAAATLPLEQIRKGVEAFIQHAGRNLDQRYFVTRTACDLAGYTDAEIAPLYLDAPTNCSFPDEWRPWLGIQAADDKTTVTRVVHCREQPYTVYIGRQNGAIAESNWANPFVIGKDGTRVECVVKFYDYLKSNKALMAKVGELRGEVLGCWCKSKEAPDALCHGDVLAAVAEGKEWIPPVESQGQLF